MTQNIWTIKDNVNLRDKNLVVFSLSSLTHADVTSVLAGSSRSKQRQQTIKDNKFSLTLAGKDSKFSPVKAAKQAPNQRKPKPPIQAKPGTVGKGPKGGKSGAKQPVSKSGRANLDRPKGYNHEVWRLANDQKRREIVANFVFVPPKPASVRVPASLSKAGIAKSVVAKSEDAFHPNDFGFDEYKNWI